MNILSTGFRQVVMTLFKDPILFIENQYSLPGCAAVFYVVFKPCFFSKTKSQ